MAGSRKIPQSRVATPVQSVEKAVEWMEQEKLKPKARGVVVPLGAGGQAKGQRGSASRKWHACGSPEESKERRRSWIGVVGPAA